MERYKVRENGDGTFAVTRGDGAVVETSSRSAAEVYREKFNRALDAEQPINQQDEE